MVTITCHEKDILFYFMLKIRKLQVIGLFLLQLIILLLIRKSRLNS